MIRIGRLVTVLLCLLGTVAASASTRYDPRLRFRTIATARFDIHFHQGEDALAQRLARIVEEVATSLASTLGPASGRVQVILVDQNDQPNGWATPLPYNTIEISAATPAADSGIGNVDDWLRLVFTHEYTHIVHLSRAQGWIGGLRRLFGRLPLLYPNLYEPIWQIEGIATWQESAQTGNGRVPAGDFRLLLERAAAERHLTSLDRASSRLVRWPSGTAAYLYGAYFHQYLADRYGAESLRRLTDATSGRLPYFGSRAFKKVYGKSLGQLWREFQQSVQTNSPGLDAAERLTHHGYFVAGPRFIDDHRVLYSLADAHQFPSLREFDLRTRTSRAVTTRYLGSRAGLAGDEAIFDQIEVVRDVGRQSDLYGVNLRNGRTRRLTRGARAANPDVSPDGSMIAFTVQESDRRLLATARLADRALAPRPLVSSPDVDFGSPRWSPDGRFIAVERRARGAAAEITIVTVATGDLRVIVPNGRNAGPVWSADGTTIFFAAARDEMAFQIFAVSVSDGTIRRLHGTGASAESPAIAPDGRSLVYVGYTADGYDLFSIPLTSARWTAETVATAARATQAVSTDEPPVPSQTYSPRRTILPQFWTPTVESDEGELVVGAATGSIDALARHAYGLEAGWAGSRARPDWQIAYAYDRFKPTFFAAVSDDTDPWFDGERRLVEADVGALLPWRHIRWSQSLLAALHISKESFECSSLEPRCVQTNGVSVRRTAGRTGLSFDSARMFGFSISPEEGGVVSTTLEYARSPSGDGGSSTSATFDVRRYQRAWPRHAVIAARAAGAASWGDRAVRRVFSASGSDPQPGGFRFGSDAIGLIRGLDDNRVFGFRAAVVNVDYRVPIAFPERGVGTLPFLLRSIHAAAFVDAGRAWPDPASDDGVRYALGAELSVDTVLGYFAPLTFTGGGVWRGGPLERDRGFAAFVRVGRAF
jgi:hypothetical protein